VEDAGRQRGVGLTSAKDINEVRRAKADAERAFADARPGPDLDFLRALVPYVWARWR